MAGEYTEIKSCIIRFSSLGDVLLSLPIIGPLAEATGGGVAFVTREPYKAVIERHPDIGAVYTIQGRGNENKREPGDLADKINSDYGMLEFAADIHDVILSSRVLKRIRAIKKATYKKDGAKRLLLAATGIDLLPEPTLSVVERYARVIKNVGAGEPDYSFRLEVDAERAKQFARDYGLETGFVAVAPRARYEAKSWQMANFIKTIEMMRERGYQVVLFDEEPLGEWGARLVKAGAKDISGKTPLDILPEALSNASTIICNDSALAHLGPLVGVPVVDIFGPTSPRFGFAPRGENDATLYTDYACSPCTRHGKRNCWRGDKACLAAILPKQVLEAVETITGDA